VLERLDLHALKAGMDRSSYLEVLVNQTCRRYVISDRGGPDAAGGPAGEDRQTSTAA
jgi:hypothetical protein